MTVLRTDAARTTAMARIGTATLAFLILGLGSVLLFRAAPWASYLVLAAMLSAVIVYLVPRLTRRAALISAAVGVSAIATLLYVATASILS